MNGKNEKPLKGVIYSLFENITSHPEFEKRAALEECWPQLIGKAFAPYTQARFTQDKKVIVKTSDSTIAFELSQKYNPAILKRLQHQFGEEEVKEVRFMVGEFKKNIS